MENIYQTKVHFACRMELNHKLMPVLFNLKSQFFIWTSDFFGLGHKRPHLGLAP